MLDKIDKNLLFELDLESRQSLGKIAEKLRISKSNVAYRIKRLEDNNIIIGYRAIINSRKLNKFFFRLFISFRYLPKKVEKEVEQYIQKSTHFGYVYKSQGHYDYSCAIWVNDLFEFQDVANSIRFKWGKYLNEVVQDMPLRIVDLQNRFLLRNVHGKRVSWTADKEDVNLDPIEKKMLFMLSDNARKPIYEMALELGVSGKQVAYRMRKLEKSDIILGYRALLNYKALGYTYFKCRINLQDYTKENYRAIREHVMQDPSVMFLVEGIGFPAIDMSAAFRTIEEFHEFIDTLKKTFPGKVGGYEIILFSKVVKMNFAPFLEE